MNAFKIKLADEDTREYASAGRAKHSAQRLADSRQIEVEVIELREVDGEVKELVAHVATYVHGRNFKPFERIENPKHPAPSVKGFMPAYTRKGPQATVYRGVERGAGWLIHDGRTGGWTLVKNTKIACGVTSQMVKKTLELTSKDLDGLLAQSAAWVAEKAAKGRRAA